MGRGQQGGHSLGIGGPKCWPGHNFSGHLQFLLLIKWEPNFLSVQGYFDVLMRNYMQTLKCIYYLAHNKSIPWWLRL